MLDISGFLDEEKEEKAKPKEKEILDVSTLIPEEDTSEQQVTTVAPAKLDVANLVGEPLTDEEEEIVDTNNSRIEDGKKVDRDFSIPVLGEVVKESIRFAKRMPSFFPGQEAFTAGADIESAQFGLDTAVNKYYTAVRELEDAEKRGKVKRIGEEKFDMYGGKSPKSLPKYFSTFGSVQLFAPTDPADQRTKEQIQERVDLQRSGLKEIKEFEQKRSEYQRAQDIAVASYNEIQKSSQEGALKIPEDQPWYDWFARVATSSALSLGQSALFSAAFGPTAGLTIVAEQSGLDSYINAKKNGLSQDEAARVMFVAALAEGIPERVGLKQITTEKGLDAVNKIFKAIGGDKLPKWIKSASTESFSETVTQIANNLNDLSYDKEFQEQVKENPAEIFKGVLESAVGGFFAGGLGEALFRGADALEQKQNKKTLVRAFERKEESISQDFNFGTIGEGNSFTPVSADLITSTPNLKVQLKAGVTPTVDHVAYMIHKNYGIDKAGSLVAALLGERIEKSREMAPGEWIRSAGLSLGTLSEKEAGFKYTFTSSEQGVGPITMTKQTDGNWKVESFTTPQDTTPATEEIVPDTKLFDYANMIQRSGYKQQTFFYSLGDEAITNLMASKDPELQAAGKALYSRKNTAHNMYLDLLRREIVNERENYEATYGKEWVDSALKSDSTLLRLSPDSPSLRKINNLVKDFTGFYLDQDGKWKFEDIRDDIEFNEDVIASVQMAAYAKKPVVMPAKKLGIFASLEEYYPEYFNPSSPQAVHVAFAPLDNSANGQYDPATRTITINTNNFLGKNAQGSVGSMADTLRHEFQHVIQYTERFGVGAASAPAYFKGKNEKKFNSEVERVGKVMPRQQSESDVEYRERIEQAVAYEMYLDTLGEMEARQATRRARMEANTKDIEYSVPTDRAAALRNRVSWEAHVDTTEHGPTFELSPGLFAKQVLSKQRLGSTTFLTTGEKLIQVFQQGNFAVLMHEYAHVAFTLLDDQELDIVAKWAESKTYPAKSVLAVLKAVRDGTALPKQGDKIYRHVQERWAKTFEEYLRQGKAPNPTLKKIFAYCKQVLTDIYFAYKKVPGSKLTPEITKVFDQLLMGKDEKFGGKIVVPEVTVTTDSGKQTTPERVFIIEEHKGQAVVRIPTPAAANGEVKLEGGFTYMNVENIIRGEDLTPKQEKIFGDTVKWESPYTWDKRIEELEARGFRTNQVIPPQVLSTMTDEQLTRVARRLRLYNRGGRYSRAEMEQLIHGKQLAALRESRKTADLEDCEDTLFYELGEGQEYFETVETVDESGKVLPATRVPNVYPTVVNYPGTNKLDWLSTLMHAWTAHMLDRVRDIPGQLAKIMYNRAVQATAYSHRKIGEGAEHVTKVQRKVRWGGKFQPGYKELMSGVDTKYGFIQNVAAHLDGEATSFREPISAAAEDILNSIREFLDYQAQVAVQEGISIRVEKRDKNGKVTGHEYVPFTPKGNRFPRAFTEDFWRILSHKDPTMRQQLTLALREFNPGMEFNEIKKIVDTMANNARTNKRIYMEAMREIPVMPTHIKTPKGGLIQILHTDPFDYVQQLNHRLALRIGFFKYFHAIDKKTGAKYVDDALIQKYLNDFRDENGEEQELKRLFNALNGVPITDRFAVNPASGFYQTYKAASNYMMIRKSLMLTKSMWVNLVEPHISTPPMVGITRYGRGLKDFGTAFVAHAGWKLGAYGESLWNGTFFHDMLVHDSWSMMKAEMIRAGTMEEKLVKFSIDPKDAVRSMSRAVANTINKTFGTSGAITFGEYFAAWNAHIMADDLRQGKGTRWDAERLRVRGYSEQEIQEIISGAAKPEVYDSLPARTIATQLGTNTLPAERSLWHNWRYANDVISFDKFWATRFRFWNQVLRSIYQETTGTPISKYTGLRKYVDNMLMLGSAMVPGKKFSPMLMGNILTSTAGGLAMMGILQLVNYGPNSWKFMDFDDDDEDEEDRKFKWIGAARDAFIGANTSGPPATMYKDVIDGRMNLANLASRIAMPVSLVKEITDIAGNLAGYVPGFKFFGRYQNDTPAEMARKLWESGIPVNGALATWFAVLGHGRKDPELAAARAGLYKWMRQHGQGAEAGGVYGKTEGNEEYYRLMNSAYNKMLRIEREYIDGKRKLFDKNDPSYVGMARDIEKALGVKYKGKLNESPREVRERLASAFQGKRLLYRLNEENREIFIKTVKPEIADKLREHDWMCDWVADRIRGR